MAYAGLKKLDRAIANFDGVFDLSRKRVAAQVVVETRVNRGLAYAAKGDYPAAIAD